MKITKIANAQWEQNRQQDKENMQGSEQNRQQGQQNIRQGGEKAATGEIRISVRSLVEFILRHGDIDNRYHAAPDNAMQEGGRIHRMIQRRMGAEYQAEVPLKIVLPAEGYKLIVEGRADGIIRHEGLVTIDEIKGTYRDLARIKAPMPLHIAQAKCYAYIYGCQQELQEVRVRLTYCYIPTEELLYFYEDYTYEELAQWFESLAASYRKWADFTWKWHGVRQASIDGLKFPFPYRNGQKELVTNVYKTIYHKKKLFLEAPTGVGKTISTIYPALQAMGKGMGEKLFYLTAKTITRTVAEDTLELLRGNGLRLKSVTLTAKEKICFMEEAECNPEYCPYARGHYDRINDAVFALLTSQETFGKKQIEEYALKHQVCPFEMCLDMSLFADAVICDYNYLFDPHVYLKRFFGDGSEGNYIFLIDEAHNLLERGREMYSAELWKESFIELRNELKQTFVSQNEKKSKKTDISGQLELETTLIMTEASENTGGNLGGNIFPEPQDSGALDHGGIYQTDAGESAWDIACGEFDRSGIRQMDEPPSARPIDRGNQREESDEADWGGAIAFKGYEDKLAYQLGKCNRELLLLKRECGQCRIMDNIDRFVQNLMRLHATLDDYLSEQEGQQPIHDVLLEFYFEVSHFLEMYELMDENYVIYTQLGEDGRFLLKLLCVNPGENLKKCMLRGRSAILFSATFLPIQYYKKLLGGEKEDYEVYAHSVFSPEKRALLISNDVTSKYTRRSEEEYDKIACYIEEIVKNRHGNYMVFCPSYAFLRTIYERYVEKYAGEDRKCIIQSEYMSETDREAFLSAFRASGGSPGSSIQAEIAAEETADRVLIGFCVLGGIFSEGIDLKNDSLIGAVIVGTGLPQICNEREILKGYFDGDGENGFDYAYRYPGMNKVLQAAGRVIRTVEDVGIIVLLDERFLQYAYRRLFPREWESFEAVTVDTVARRVERFWDEWL